MAKNALKTKTERKPRKATKTAKPKLAVVKKDKAVKAPKVDKLAKYEVLGDPDAAPVARDGEKSGAYIQRLLSLEIFTPQEIAAATCKQFKDSVAKSSDVSFHRTKLKKAGTVYRTVRILTSGERVVSKD